MIDPFDGKNSPFTSIQALNHMIRCEPYHEVAILPHLLKITKTDFGVSLGLDKEFWDGSYDKDSSKKTIRLQDVIHHGAFVKSFKKPEIRPLPPPGFTIMQVSLAMLPIHLTRFFLLHYSKRYKALPSASKWTLYNGVRASCIWECWNEKIHMEEQGIQAFACREVYERISKGRELFETYPKEIKRINAAAKAYRNSRGYYGYSAAVAYDRRQEVYISLNGQAEEIASLPIMLPPRPVDVPEFKLLEEPPLEMFEGEV